MDTASPTGKDFLQFIRKELKAIHRKITREQNDASHHTTITPMPGETECRTWLYFCDSIQDIQSRIHTTWARSWKQNDRRALMEIIRAHCTTFIEATLKTLNGAQVRDLAAELRDLSSVPDICAAFIDTVCSVDKGMSVCFDLAEAPIIAAIETAATTIAWSPLRATIHADLTTAWIPKRQPSGQTRAPSQIEIRPQAAPPAAIRLSTTDSRKRKMVSFEARERQDARTHGHPRRSPGRTSPALTTLTRTSGPTRGPIQQGVISFPRTEVRSGEPPHRRRVVQHKRHASIYPDLADIDVFDNRGLDPRAPGYNPKRRAPASTLKFDTQIECKTDAYGIDCEEREATNAAISTRSIDKEEQPPPHKPVVTKKNNVCTLAYHPPLPTAYTNHADFPCLAIRSPKCLKTTTQLPPSRWPRNITTKAVQCTFHQNGSCQLGPECPYSHTPPPLATCQFFLAGTCRFGNRCRQSHTPGPPPGAPPRQIHLMRRQPAQPSDFEQPPLPQPPSLQITTHRAPTPSATATRQVILRRAAIGYPASDYLSVDEYPAPFRHGYAFQSDQRHNDHVRS
jgi:hypothetical protein